MSWTKEEKARLIDIYPKTPIKTLLLEFSGRDRGCIRQMASTLGLKKEIYFWNKDEEDKLKKIFETCTKKELLEAFPGKKYHAIYGKSQDLGLKKDWKYRGYLWKKYEDRILKNMYFDASYKDILKKLPGRTINAIRMRAEQLKLLRPYVNPNGFSKSEEKIVRRFYPKKSWKFILKRLPGWKMGSITKCANRIGVNRILFDRPSNQYWSEKDKIKLKKYYPTGSWKFLENIFPGKSRQSLIGHAGLLGIKRLKKEFENAWTKREDDILRKYAPDKGSGWVHKNKIKNRTLNSVKERRRKLKVYKSDLYCNPNRGVSFDPLLMETNKAYYWNGLLMADGNFRDCNRINLLLQYRDRRHVKMFAKFINSRAGVRINNGRKYVFTYGNHASACKKLVAKFGYENDKTHNPPFNIRTKNNDMFMSLMIGLLDGDGHIQWEGGTKGRHFSVSVHCHKSWEKWLLFAFKRMMRIVNDGGHLHSYIHYGRYVTVSIFSMRFLLALKKYMIRLRVPYLHRKWDKIK